jgi:hypothetical protein
MSKRKLISIAKDYAKRQGWDVDRYEVAHFEEKGGECWVLFEAVKKAPGGHFSVYLDPKSGRVLRLIPGR